MLKKKPITIAQSVKLHKKEYSSAENTTVKGNAKQLYTQGVGLAYPAETRY